LGKTTGLACLLVLIYLSLRVAVALLAHTAQVMKDLAEVVLEVLFIKRRIQPILVLRIRLL
jgi:hypothetical protein